MRVRVRVRGRVQGVFFRESTRRAARASGVRGWVRNLPDGSVEALIDGEPAAVRSVLDFVRVGPELARVADVEVALEEATGADLGEGFEVR